MPVLLVYSMTDSQKFTFSAPEREGLFVEMQHMQFLKALKGCTEQEDLDCCIIAC